MIFFRDIPPVCLTVLRRRGGGLDRAGRILPGQRAEAERAVRPAGDGAEHIHAGRLGHDHGAEQKRGQQGRRRGDPEQCAPFGPGRPDTRRLRRGRIPPPSWPPGRPPVPAPTGRPSWDSAARVRRPGSQAVRPDQNGASKENP